MLNLLNLILKIGRCSTQSKKKSFSIKSPGYVINHTTCFIKFGIYTKEKITKCKYNKLSFPMIILCIFEYNTFKL